MKFEILVLGVGSATPTLVHSPSAQVLITDTHNYLIDCGEGTQYRLLKHKVKAAKISQIFISHLHGDHYLGLMGLISSLNLNQRSLPLTVYGPKGLQQIIEVQMQASGTSLHFELRFVEIQTQSQTKIMEDERFEIYAIALQHRIPCWGFYFVEKPKEKKIDSTRVPEDLPPEYFKKLKNGEDILWQNTLIKAEEVCKAPIGERRSYAYISDTSFLPNIAPYFEKATLLYHEATFTEELAGRAGETFHCTAKQAAQMAELSKAQKLMLGHFSSRYKNLDGHLAEAQGVFEPTFLAVEGETYSL